MIKISSTLSLPKNATTQKLAFLGISGSGKTYAAGKFTEELLDAGAQVVIMDTVGNWYGLRLAADGKKPGISIPVLGGARGDVPLEAVYGKLAAETVAGSRASMILDVSDFTKGELGRFVLDFATELLRLKKKSPSPVMVIWEECQDVVPQRVNNDQARTVGAVERLIKKGRNYGVGTVLISQRPAAVNKDVLSQVETLFAFRLNGKHDRKAIAEWIVEKDLDIGKLVDELPAMKTGTCYVWSPQWLETFEKVAIGKKRTFDASATPDFDDVASAGPLAPVDLEQFKKTMGDAIEKAKDSDPETLRTKVRELERQLKVAQGNAMAAARLVEMKTPPIDLTPLKELRTTILSVAADLRAARDLSDKLSGILLHVAQRADEAETDVRTILDMRANTPTPRQIMREAAQRREEQGMHRGHVLPPRPDGKRLGGPRDIINGRDADRDNLTGPECRVLDAIAWFAALGIEAPETVAVAFMAGYSGENGTFNNVRAKLRGAGLVEYGTGTTKLTMAGVALARRPDIELTTQGIHNAVMARLDGPQQRVLLALLRNYPAVMSAEELAEASGYGSVNGTFNNVRGRLRTLGLVEYPSAGMTRARDILFVGA